MKLRLRQTANLESAILKQVRAHPGISRISLAHKLQIAPSTVSNYTERLITEGFLVESEKAETGTGRPPTALRLNADGGQFIGIDFEARNIMAMAVDFSDVPLRQAHKSIETTDTVSDIIAKIESAITEVLPATPGPLLAIGVGVPGLVNPAAGVAVHYKYINGWQNVALAEPLSKRFGVPVYLENNVRSMALAELWFGRGRGVRDWLCIGIRSGIGAGIVVGGQLHHGANHRAGEIGRWLCPELAEASGRYFANPQAGSAGPLELQEIASVRAIVAALERARQSKARTMLSAHEQPLVFADVVRAASQQDRLTLQVIEAAADMLGWAVSELALALNPSLVILAGPLTLLGDTLLHPLRRRAEEILQASGGDVPEIVGSLMGEHGGALGAAALAVHEWKPAR